MSSSSSSYYYHREYDSYVFIVLGVMCFDLKVPLMLKYAIFTCRNSIIIHDYNTKIQNNGQIRSVVRLLQVKLMWRRRWFSQPALLILLLISAVTHGGIHLFRHHPDHFVGHFLVAVCWSPIPACLSQAPREPSSSLHQAAWPCCCPPRTDAEAPFDFSSVSHSLGVDRETSSGCFSRVFLCIFSERQSEFQVALFIFFATLEPCRSSMWYWLTENKRNTWKRRRRKMCSVSGHVFFLHF